MEQRTAIVTGGYGKIGKAIATKIAMNQRYRVVILGRSELKLIESVEYIIHHSSNCNVEYRVVDLSSKTNIEEFSKKWVEGIDVIVNNAATTPVRRQETSSGIEMQFATNVLGYLWMMLYLNKFMVGRNDPRIVNIASYWAGNLDIDDLEFKKRNYDNDTAYRQSKQANRMLSKFMSEMLKIKGVGVLSCHPGDVNSKLSNSLGFGGHESPMQGADTPAWLALRENAMEFTGKYFEHRNEKQCHFSRDDSLNRKLYNECMKY